MELLKNLFKSDDRVIGLCGFKKEDEENLRVFIPKFEPAAPVFTANYQKNFFLT